MAHPEHSHCDHQCHIPPTSHVHQTLDELEFERGIWNAALYGDVERVLQLLEKGTNVDIEDSSGYTALHYAARGGHENVCEVLLKNGANVNATTRCGGASALHRACSAGKIDIVKMLLKYNANVTLKDNDGKTALHRGAEAQNLKVCLTLLSVCPLLKFDKDLKSKLPVDYSHMEELVDLLHL